MTKEETLRLALEALELVSIEVVCNGAHHAKKDRHEWLDPCPIVDRYKEAITAIKEALETKDEPKCVAIVEVFGKDWRLDYMSLPVGKHKLYAQQYTYTTTPQPETKDEPVSMRMPKVGDRVVCIEDESLGVVHYLTAGGSPEIRFDDGSHGTYLLREFAELFGYADTTPQRVWVGLTDEERQEIHGSTKSPYDDLLLIEAKLKEKNI